MVSFLLSPEYIFNCLNKACEKFTNTCQIRITSTNGFFCKICQIRITSTNGFFCKILSKAYLSHVENKIGNSGQRSTTNMDKSFNVQMLKSHFNLWKFQINSAIKKKIETRKAQSIQIFSLKVYSSMIITKVKCQTRKEKGCITRLRLKLIKL